MIMRTRNHSGILLLAACIIFAVPAAGHADDLFRLYPELQMNGFYGDNIPLRTTNQMGDFGTTMFAGLYLDYTSAARYAALHWDTFAQLFAHQSRYDRAGEGQFVGATDEEKLSPTTGLRLDEFFGRDTPGYLGLITGDQAPKFNPIAAQLLLANYQASINYVNARLFHNWGRNWHSDVALHQETFWGNGSNSFTNNTSYEQSIETTTQYHFTNHFSLGAGYRFYDFRFSGPGIPGQQAHWPFAVVTWSPMQRFYFKGTVGVVVSHTQGTNTQTVNPGGEALLEYTLQRGHLRIDGGQRPELTGGFAGANELRWVGGSILYDFTPRLTGMVGGGYYDMLGSRILNGQLVTWGVGLTERVNKWLSVYTRFVEIRRNENAPSQFLPSGNQNGQEAVGNYICVGFSASIEAFRWSWQ